MNIILLGPPGAGKGSLASLLNNSVGIEHISTGDLLREELSNETELGQKAKIYMEKGELVPDDLVTQMIEQKLTQSKNENGYMLDGFPRTSNQAFSLDEMLARINKPLNYVFYMEAELDLIITRLTGRRVCKSCGSVSHVVNHPSKQEGVCDKCDGETYQRSDDKEDTIRNRMEVYFQNTMPIVEYYRAKDKLVSIDGNKESENLAEEVIGIIDEQKPIDYNSDS